MRILIIEDEENLAELLLKIVKKAGYSADAAQDGERGSFLARTCAYDLIITDFILPKLDGLGVIKEIRRDGKNMPILMLSVRQSTEDKVGALEEGADDYLAKPFSAEELIARIKALLRRHPHLEENNLQYRDLILNVQTCRVWRKNKEIRLANKEFAILQHLLIKPGHIISREYLLEHIWDNEIDSFSNTVETHILRLRRKLGKDGNKIIENIANRGYRLR